jgi:hypothetical protein
MLSTVQREIHRRLLTAGYLLFTILTILVLFLAVFAIRAT